MLCVSVCVFVNQAYLYKCDSVSTRQPNPLLLVLKAAVFFSIHTLSSLDIKMFWTMSDAVRGPRVEEVMLTSLEMGLLPSI